FIRPARYFSNIQLSNSRAQPKAKIHSETSPFFQVTGKILGASTYSIPIFPDSTEPSSFTSVSYKYGMYATVPVYALYEYFFAFA
ncbi:MAG: hypothetical protein ACLRML_03740, partial [[Ruminococcus] lactaris]